MKFPITRTWSLLSLLCLTFLADSTSVQAQPRSYVFETLAGAPKLPLQQYGNMVFDGNDTLYCISRGVIYRFSAASGISAVSDSGGSFGPWDGPVDSARFYNPTALAVAGDGSLYVGDSLSVDGTIEGRIRIISPAGYVSTLELAADSELKTLPGQLQNLAFDRNGNLYTTVVSGHAIYRIDAQRHLHALPTDFETVGGLAVDDVGNVYFADYSHSLILKANPQGEISTVLDGNTVTDEGLSLQNPASLALDGSDTLYVSCWGQTVVFKVALAPKPKLSLYAGKPGTAGGQDGPLDTATFFDPSAIALDHRGRVHVIDFQSQPYASSIRRISDGAVTTVLGGDLNAGSQDGQGREARFNHPEGVAVDAAQNVFVADTGNSTIRRISPSGAVSTVAGQAGVTGSDDGTGADARFSKPSGVAVDSHGILYVADTGNHIIRRITPAGEVSTVAGTKGQAGYVDGALSKFSGPLGLAIGPDDTVYVADTGNWVIRQILSDGQVKTVSQSFVFSQLRGVTVLTNGLIFVTGGSYRSFVGFQPGQNALMSVAINGVPAGLVADASGNFFLTSTSSAGSDESGLYQVYGPLSYEVGGNYNGLNDGLGRHAQFQQPLGIAVDWQGNLYVADTGSSTIRKGRVSQGASVLSFAWSTNVLAGNDCTFNLAFGGTPPLRYQWWHDGIELPGATNASLTLQGVSTNDSGEYEVLVANDFGSDQSFQGSGLTVLATPPSTNPNGSGTATIGFPYSIKANPSGAKPWSFQWFLNGKLLAAQTNEIMSLASVTSADGGNYTVALTNPYGSYTSSIPFRLGIALSPSVNPPASRKVFSGEDVVFMVRSLGAAPVNYQWLHDGNPLPAGTNAVLKLANVTAADAGGYNLTLSSPYGTYTTQPSAVLTVLDGPPVILRQPSSEDVRAGVGVSFRVDARGTGPLAYQWRLNDQALEGATNAALVLTGVTAAEAGRYAVTVSNGLGAKDSGEAVLTVAPLVERPFPQDQAVLFGDEATLDAPEVGFPASSYLWSQSALGNALSVPLFGAYQPWLTRSNVSVLMYGRLSLRTWTDYSVRVADESGAGTNSRPAIVSAFPATPALLPITLSGWSHDVVLEDGPISHIDTAFDDNLPYDCWIEAGVQSHGDGLPPFRRLASAKDTNVLFELPPYAGPNALWMRANTGTNMAGTLRLVRPARYARLALLAATTFGFGEGSPGAMVLQFTDGSCSGPLPFNCPDWWVNSSTNFLAFGGLTEAQANKLAVTNNKVTIRFPDTQPAYGMGLYQTDLDLVALGLADKQLAAITFQAPMQGQPTGVFAVSGREIDNPGRPYFVADPAAQLVQSGGQLRLTCLAVGEQPMEYQWFKDGIIIPDVSGPMFTVDPVFARDAARYTVVAKNAVGTALSAPAVIEVSGPPTLAIASLNGQPVLAWPDGDFVLEQRSTLGPDTGWEAVTTGIVTAAGQSTYAIDGSDGAHFFRLRQR